MNDNFFHIEGPWIKDDQNRTLLLRGVNLSGASKVPVRPNGATHNGEGFFDHRNVSFGGRPFPLDEADEHFERLRIWGFTFLRFLITWEAIEHAGPGIYDQAYLDYIHAVLEKANQHGIRVFIDPHQDVWSRFSGGDGAPGWTMEAVGFDLKHLHETGAAIVHAVHGDPFPPMIWPTNSSKLASATMFTLFFAGNDFAPQVKVGGIPIQEYLQSHYIQAISKLAERLQDLPNIVGYDTFNEPLHGYLGWQHLDRREGILQSGPTPTPYQSMLLGAGYPQQVDIMDRQLFGIKRVRRELLNPEGLRAWRDNFDCIWRQHGVWDLDRQGNPRLLQPNYFKTHHGKQVDFANDYLKPFINCYAQAIRTQAEHAFIFIEGEAFHQPPCWTAEDARDIIYTPHWYDAIVLYFKAFNAWLAIDVRGRGRIVFGSGLIRRSFAAQIAHFKHQARDCLENAPTLIGEFGIAFDMHGKHAYHSGDYRQQVRALDRSLRAMEDNLINFTIWNYTPDNSNQRGDLWNDEDLSIFSRDQQTNPADSHSGGRALEALLRPYPMKTAGQPLELSFDYRKGLMVYRFRHDAGVNAPTEFYIPTYQYPDGCLVEVSDGKYELDLSGQRLLYWHTLAIDVHMVKVKRLPKAHVKPGEQQVNRNSAR
jgi:hypothetical protein